MFLGLPFQQAEESFMSYNLGAKCTGKYLCASCYYYMFLIGANIASVCYLWPNYSELAIC